jgi:hypothetical protein
MHNNISAISAPSIEEDDISLLAHNSDSDGESSVVYVDEDDDDWSIKEEDLVDAIPSSVAFSSPTKTEVEFSKNTINLNTQFQDELKAQKINHDSDDDLDNDIDDEKVPFPPRKVDLSNSNSSISHSSKKSKDKTKKSAKKDKKKHTSDKADADDCSIDSSVWKKKEKKEKKKKKTTVEKRMKYGGMSLRGRDMGPSMNMGSAHSIALGSHDDSDGYSEDDCDSDEFESDNDNDDDKHGSSLSKLKKDKLEKEKHKKKTSKDHDESPKKKEKEKEKKSTKVEKSKTKKRISVDLSVDAANKKEKKSPKEVKSKKKKSSGSNDLTLPLTDAEETAPMKKKPAKDPAPLSKFLDTWKSLRAARELQSRAAREQQLLNKYKSDADDPPESQSPHRRYQRRHSFKIAAAVPEHPLKRSNSLRSVLARINNKESGSMVPQPASHSEECETLIRLRIDKLRKKRFQLGLQAKQDLFYLRQDFETKKEALRLRIQSAPTAKEKIAALKNENTQALTGNKGLGKDVQTDETDEEAEWNIELALLENETKKLVPNLPTDKSNPSKDNFNPSKEVARLEKENERLGKDYQSVESNWRKELVLLNKLTKESLDWQQKTQAVAARIAKKQLAIEPNLAQLDRLEKLHQTLARELRLAIPQGVARSRRLSTNS